MASSSVQSDDQSTIKRRDIGSLLLDPENPRISVPPKTKEPDIVKILYETQALDELALSLVRNGYFLEEPVVIVPAENASGKFVVVEGNRRVATIKILIDPKLRKAVGADEWPSLTENR